MKIALTCSIKPENVDERDLVPNSSCIARTREKYLESGMGKRYLKNRLKRFLFLTG